MKKIISALAVSALVFGSAAAKTSVNLNYRQGTSLYSYTDNGEDKSAGYVESRFNALGDFTQQDTLSLKASGDIFDFQADIQPTTADAIRFNVLKIGAKWGSFHTQAGWNGDGINGGYRVTNDASNWDGQYFETFKLGSLFTDSFSKYSDNQINMGGKIFVDRNMYAQADYTVAADDLKVKLIGTVISDRAWNRPETERNNGDKGWSVFADVSKGNLFKAEAFVKGATVSATKKDESTADDRLALVPGLYVQWLGTDNLIATVGGAASFYDGDLCDYSFDLRARYAVSSQLSFTYYLKYSELDTDNYIATTAHAANAAVDKNLGLAASKVWNGSNKPNAFTTDAALWNFLNARYTLNPTVAVSCALGVLTDMGDGKVATGKSTNNGSTVSITPAAEFTAGKGASIIVGVNATLCGVGADKDSEFGKETDIGFGIPMYFRVKM